MLRYYATKKFRQKPWAKSSFDLAWLENNDICRDMSTYPNIEGFLTYWCICDVYRQGSVWGFPMVLYWWHKLGKEKIHNAFTRCPRDLSLLSGLRPRAGWGCPTLIWSLFNSTKAQGTVLDLHGAGIKMWCFQEGKLCSKLTMSLLWWHKFLVGKIHNAFTSSSWDLSLYPAYYPGRVIETF